MPKDSGRLNIDTLANCGDMLDRLIAWKLQSPREGRRHGNRTTAISEEKHMQRQFNIELRVDYEDPGKNDAMRKACAAAARHMFATAQLIADGIAPQIAIFSDDYFSGTQEIALLENAVQQGIDELGMSGEQEAISSELMGAVRDQT